MGANSHTLSPNGVVDELGLFCSKAIQTLLDDMIAIQVLNQLYHMIFQCVNDRLCLLFGGDKLDHLL
jgi:hypothetical protein